ncbi:MAG: DsrE family protein [Acidobacteria bacterium]|nr:DsrE family protein [Acidobacteriota bacterium]
MKILIILNEPPYGNEGSYNGLRLAGSLARQIDMQLKVFLIGDAVSCAKAGQKVPQGFYNVQLMLAAVLRHTGVIGACGSCLDARGIRDQELIEGVKRGSMEELTAWTLEADKVISF